MIRAIIIGTIISSIVVALALTLVMLGVQWLIRKARKRKNGKK